MSSKKRFSSSSSHLPPLATISSSPPSSWLGFEQMRMESDFCDVAGSEGGGRQSNSDNLRPQLNRASLMYINHSRLTAREQFFVALGHFLVRLLTILKYFTRTYVRFVVFLVLFLQSLNVEEIRNWSSEVGISPTLCSMTNFLHTLSK